MDARIEIKGAEEIKRKIKAIPDDLYEVAVVAMRKTMGGLQAEMVRRSGGDNGNPLRSITGALRKSWQLRIEGSNINTLAGIVESAGVRYASIHEYGGIIRAKGGQWLTIPTTANKTPAGKTRLTARMVINQGGFFAKNIIFLKKGKKGTPVPMFILKKQVKIPARLGFREQAEIYGKKLLVELNDILEK